MGEKTEFQPLTKEDKITVVLYRIGIVFSTSIISALGYLAVAAASLGSAADILAYGLYVSVGLSVFFIHLYIKKLKVFLTILYFFSVVCLAALVVLGKGSVSDAVVRMPYGPLLLLPIAGCLGFLTVKEAFCFQLFEGYLLAMIMPLYLVLYSAGILTDRSALSGLVLIAFMLVVFTLRKVFQPLAYDIGDKSAYH